MSKDQPPSPPVAAPAPAALESPPPDIVAAPPAASTPPTPPNWVEKATMMIAGLALVGTAINGCYVFFANKEYVEAEKLRDELALYRMKRAEVTASAIPSNVEPWGEHLDLCTVTGSYQLRNVGTTPIRIGSLVVRVFETDLGEPPADGAKISSISVGTRLNRPPILIEELPDSAGLVMPGEPYSRSYGYIIRRDTGKQYAIEVSPRPVDPHDYEPTVFRAWSNLTGICLPPPALAPLTSP